MYLFIGMENNSQEDSHSLPYNKLINRKGHCNKVPSVRSCVRFFWIQGDPKRDFNNNHSTRNLKNFFGVKQ